MSFSDEAPTVISTLIKGSAYSAKNTEDGTMYVAKKMALDGLGEKEKSSAWG